MTTTNGRPSNAVRAEIIAALIKGPRTVHDICEMVESSEDGARQWINALRGAGMVRVAHRPPKGRAASDWVYEWQAAPFALPDAEVHIRTKQRATARRLAESKKGATPLSGLGFA